MKKIIIWLVVVIMTAGLTGCKKEDNIKKESSYIVKTYEKTDTQMVQETFDKSETVIKTTYYEMSDGTWKTDNYTYKYRLELSGRLNNAEKDSTYTVLSNIEDITFEQAWKASGLSSNTNDYFDEKDVVIVGLKLTDFEE